MSVRHGFWKYIYLFISLFGVMGMVDVHTHTAHVWRERTACSSPLSPLPAPSWGAELRLAVCVTHLRLPSHL